MVPSINFDQMGKEEKIIGGCFQTTKRKVKIFFFLNFLTSAAIDFQLSVRCVRNYDYFQFISRLFPCDINNLWEFNFCGWRQFALCRKKNHVLLCMTDSFISETSAWGRMLYWKDGEEWRNEGRKEGRKEWRKEGRKEGMKEGNILNFYYFLFPLSL